MKKILMLLPICVITAISEELSQYEALSKLNDVSGKIIVIQKDFEKRLKNLESSLNNIEISNFNKKMDDLVKRIEAIESKLSINNDIIEETIIQKTIINNKDKRYLVNIGYLNVRNEPNKSSKIIIVYSKGTTFTGIDLGNEWIKIKDKNLFLYKKYLKEI